MKKLTVLFIAAAASCVHTKPVQSPLVAQAPATRSTEEPNARRRRFQPPNPGYLVRKFIGYEDDVRRAFGLRMSALTGCRDQTSLIVISEPHDTVAFFFACDMHGRHPPYPLSDRERVHVQNLVKAALEAMLKRNQITGALFFFSIIAPQKTGGWICTVEAMISPSRPDERRYRSAVRMERADSFLAILLTTIMSYTLPSGSSAPKPTMPNHSL